MRVILTKDVSGLGRAGDIKEVSDGHARNFLIPKHLALPATTEMLNRVQKEEQERQVKLVKDQEIFSNLKNKLENTSFIIIVKDSGKNKLYSSIHQAEIADSINKKTHLSITPKQVIINPVIQTLGTHNAEIILTESIHAKVKIEVKKQE